MKVHVNEACAWDYTSPAPLNVRLLLLTKDNRVEVGPWKGGPIGENRTYKAWHGLPQRDETRERALEYV